MNFFIILVFHLLNVKSEELIMVAEFFRHGAREPVYDLYDSKNFPSKGELTSVGMRQHFNLGSIIRHEYIEKKKFLSHQYEKSEIFVSSTNFNRTIISALSQLYGLYPLGTGHNLTNLSKSELYQPPFEIEDKSFAYPSIFNQEALPGLFQPIPIHNIGVEDLTLRPFDDNICPLSKIWKKQQLKNGFLKELENELNYTLKSVEKLMNLTNITLEIICHIYDVFQNDIWAGNPLPLGYGGSLKKNMSFIYNFWNYYVTFGTERQRLSLSGALFLEIREFFKRKILGEETKKWLMYSAHDTTLIMILAALDLNNYNCILTQWRLSLKENYCFQFPEYAASLIMELYKNNEADYLVKIRYNGKYIKTYEYKEFEEIMNRSIEFMKEDEEYLNICQKNIYTNEIHNEVAANKKEIWLFYIGIIFGWVLLLIFYFMFIFIKRVSFYKRDYFKVKNASSPNI